MVGAGLECAVDHLLQVAWRCDDGRLDPVQGDGTCARPTCRPRAMIEHATIEIVLLVAVADNGVIGAQGAIPWRQKSDMRRLKALTMGRPIVMGRKTFVSFPRRPLPGRTNIVITRDQSFRAAGAVVTTSLSEALATARGEALRRSAADIAVLGG